ncbi:hypothetical protein D3C71_1258290 [compost metagenome]
MPTDEIRNTTYIALGAILLASLLGFVAYLFTVRSDIANLRNTEVVNTATLKGYREFNKYSGKILFGEDVVSTIRDYYGSDIRIRVNDSTSIGTFNVDKYIARSDPSKIDIANLQTWFPTQKKYKAVLVYGQVDLNTVTESWDSYASTQSDVSAIVFFYAGMR